MQRTIYNDDHQALRLTVREYLRRSVEPHYLAWEEAGITDRAAWKEAGAAGLLAFNTPEEFGGAGPIDFRYNMVFDEEAARGGYSSLANGFNVHVNIVTPYIADLGTPEQKEQLLPEMASGNTIGAIAMTEPGAGSDLRGIRTTAVRDGDDWILNGAKTFISNGILSDVVIVTARTDPSAGSRGFTLFLVERGTPGFERGRKLDKVGLTSQDTAELSFHDVRIPGSAVLGTVGQGLIHLMERLPRERLGIASMATASIRASYEWTARYAFDRSAFGSPIGDLSTMRFTLAEIATEADVAESLLDRSALELNAETLSPVDAAKVKWYTTEMQASVVSRCMQVFGGYGYMTEYPIGRAFRDSRVTTIYGGTTQIMKEIIGRDIAASH